MVPLALLTLQSKLTFGQLLGCMNCDVVDLVDL